MCKALIKKWGLFLMGQAVGLGLLAPAWLHAGGSPNIIWQQSFDSDRINGVAFTPDGNTLATGSSDRLICVWNASNGTLLKALNSNAPAIHPSSCESVAFDPIDTDIIGSVNADAEHIWHWSEGTELDLTPPTPTNWMVWCAFSPNGAYFATSCFNGDTYLWKTADWSAPYKIFGNDTGQQRAVAFSPDGKWMASAGSDQMITVRSTTTWAVAATLKGHTDTIYDIAFSPDSTMIASGSYDLTARIWNVNGWSLKYTLANNNGTPGSDVINGVTFSPDSQTLAYADTSEIYLVNTANGQVYQNFDENTTEVQCMAFSSKGLLAYGVIDDTVYVADVLSGTPPTGPSVSVTSPVNGANFTATANVTLEAAASSPNGVTSVTYYDESNNNLGSASSSPYSVAWNNLAAGSYTVTAVVLDGSGNTATSGPVNFTVSSNGGGGGGSDTLTVTVVGDGHVVPNRGSESLVIGRKYLIEAIPVAGNVFNGWSDSEGDVITNAADFDFTMESGLALQANFIPNPFPAVDGLYYGIVQSDPTTFEGAGKITVSVTPSGTFTAGFYFGDAVYSFAGKFANDGYYSRSIPRGRNSPLLVDLTLDTNSGSGDITGTISDGTVISSVSAARRSYNVRNNPAPVGHYTIVIPPDTSQPNNPQGYGVGLVTIAATGLVTINGRLADGVAFSDATYLSQDKTFPLFALVNAGRESISGLMTVESLNGSDLDGTVSWFRQPVNNAGYYSTGFANVVTLIGSLYTNPPAGSAALQVSPGTDDASVTLTAADFANPLTFTGDLNTRFQFITDTASTTSTPPKRYTMVLNRNGIFSGSFVDPNSNKLATFFGALFPDSNVGEGYFLSGGQSGSIVISAAGQ
jgi:WD40 repeat protein